MSQPELTTKGGLRIAVEGCGHGKLHDIYASIEKSCELKGWPSVDLLIIGGDFQAVRNALDLKAISMPEKYYDMADFHEYYSGSRTAPYLTIFIGGNHEASNHMWELYYGGWAAPNIYYMGAANVIRLGPLRIAGLSGIWKGYDYRKAHYERLPYNDKDVRSIYHVRELDVRKLLQLRSQVDVGLSHDWPNGMEWKGDHQQLFRFKPYFEKDAQAGTLGNIAATQVLERLRPAHWFSAHMHARYTAVWKHAGTQTEEVPTTAADVPSKATNEDEIDLDLDDAAPAEAPKNDAEIDLDIDDDEPAKPVAEASANTTSNEKTTEVPKDVRALLPESFAKPKREPKVVLPFPSEITNKETQFLALDKCLPNRHFLQLLEIEPHKPAEFARPLRLEYDAEWLAITRVFADHLVLGNPGAHVPADKGDGAYRPLIEKELEWVEQNIVQAGKMAIPEDFERTAPVYDPTRGIHVSGTPQEYSNPHTQGFCDLLQIPNPFHATDDERAKLMQKGPRGGPIRDDGARGGRGGGGRRRARR
ncbi:lariat debranching enzyme [Periconia macrospinosa]|uniref:Lariat debranching enzyme n=1 Tax=Periconia macrospinosa TaxID=97972 RepID=A0A2V1DXV1_9PLEO|nr:lariat debranching enzyme [Periconia macrospinosa]